MDLNEKLDLAAGVKHKGNQYFKVLSQSFILANDFVRVHTVINCYNLLLLGRAVLPGSCPVSVHHLLVRDGVWYWDRAAEEDTRLRFDCPPQFSVVFPAAKRVFTSSGELQ